MRIASYGVGFILLGVLSYIIPIFGYQFRIIDAFDRVTGGLGGALFIVIGIAIIAVGLALQRTRV